MNCHAIRAVLDLHAENRLTPGRAKAVAAHLKSCAACRALSSPVTAEPLKSASGDFKARLAASLKAERRPAPSTATKLELWPRDLSGVAFAAAALAAVALAIGWTGVQSQRDMGGDELAFGRMP